MVLESSVLMMSECVKISQRKSIVLRQIRNAPKIKRPIEAFAWICSVKKVFLKVSQNAEEDICTSSPQSYNFIKKETPAQVFFGKFCKIFENNHFLELL